MFIEKDGYMQYLIKYKITPNQFWFLYLRHTLDTDSLEEYIKAVRPWKREEIRDLVDRGLLDDLNSKGEEYAHAYFVSPTMLKDMFDDLEEPGEQLWDAYPPFFHSSDGTRYSARTCDKEWLEKTYGKRIKYSKKKHDKILELVAKLKSENKISMGIEKFVVSEQWSSIWQAEEAGVSDKRSETSAEV